MNWKDFTAIAAVVFVLAVIGVVLFQLPIAQLSDWRPATILLTILGLMIFFTISPLFAATSKPESISTALLGVSALILAFVGLIFNNRIIFLLFCSNLAILWSLTIYYHIQAHKSNRVHQ